MRTPTRGGQKDSLLSVARSRPALAFVEDGWSTVLGGWSRCISRQILNRERERDAFLTSQVKSFWIRCRRGRWGRHAPDELKPFPLLPEVTLKITARAILEVFCVCSFWALALVDCFFSSAVLSTAASPEREKRAAMAPLMANVARDEGSSSVTSSPLKTFSLMTLSPPRLPPYAPWLRELKSDERGLCLIHLLLNCANHVAAGSLDRANAFLEQIALLAAPDGDAMQRIASHFTEALARRALRLWPGLYHALDSTRTVLLPLAEAAAARRHFLDLCPFLRLAFVVTNQVIMEAMEGERVVHIVDLNASDATQWISLLQGLRARPEGPPHLKITGVHEHRELLNHTAVRLSEEAERLDIPFQFNAVVSRLDNLDVESLRVKTGEALAISSVLQLHSLLASNDNASDPRKAQRVAPISQLNLGEFLDKDHAANGHSPSVESALSLPFASASSPARMDSFLASLWGLSPKLMVVTEQEANHNAPALNERFVEALFYYAAMFDCLDSTVPRQSIERLRVEKMLLGEEIKNIIACEGWERKERHEKLQKWAQRMDSAGFGMVPLSYYGLLARRLLHSFGCDGYKVKEENGCFMVCWQDRSLYSISAWTCKRYD
ncbi:Scarecrow-like protein [Musa troglodytarum]|uniref:Scarecrow-like protein n=1 Tax=Musa troglodytarum TaxID=320322 RepID=A0A9E7EJI6_9LILI|nr:Scarecrow-like protein [Musa troglodytarum]